MRAAHEKRTRVFGDLSGLRVKLATGTSIPTDAERIPRYLGEIGRLVVRSGPPVDDPVGWSFDREIASVGERDEIRTDGPLVAREAPAVALWLGATDPLSTSR